MPQTSQQPNHSFQILHVPDEMRIRIFSPQEILVTKSPQNAQTGNANSLGGFDIHFRISNINRLFASAPKFPHSLQNGIRKRFSAIATLITSLKNLSFNSVTAGCNLFETIANLNPFSLSALSISTMPSYGLVASRQWST